MNDQTTDPNTEQITVWRNLLDAFGQLSAAWDAAGKAQQEAESGSGPDALGVPESLVAAFARAGEETADTLVGIASVLSQQEGNTEPFAELAESQRRTRDQWARAHESLNTTSTDRPAD